MTLKSMLSKMIHPFRNENSSWEQELERAQLQGWLNGYETGKKESFDEGYTQGYNDGRASGIEDTKKAALQSLNLRGDHNGNK